MISDIFRTTRSIFDNQWSYRRARADYNVQHIAAAGSERILGAGTPFGGNPAGITFPAHSCWQSQIGDKLVLSNNNNNNNNDNNIASGPFMTCYEFHIRRSWVRNDLSALFCWNNIPNLTEVKWLALRLGEIL